eukprot:TRINITY_DN1078_c0_g1_i2.p1 TRINITY_DN1078_c0_g1~~TRINITY_DN1078_c0_g1_i2.p1  ORF type:complete len:297 (+),score=36.48 TRINITY_DN1078_c0_g1_i2:84-974(+)
MLFQLILLVSVAALCSSQLITGEGGLAADFVDPTEAKHAVNLQTMLSVHSTSSLAVAVHEKSKQTITFDVSAFSTENNPVLRVTKAAAGSSVSLPIPHGAATFAYLLPGTSSVQGCVTVGGNEYCGPSLTVTTPEIMSATGSDVDRCSWSDADPVEIGSEFSLEGWVKIFTTSTKVTEIVALNSALNMWNIVYRVKNIVGELNLELYLTQLHTEHYFPVTIEMDTWTHLVVTFKKGDSTMHHYKNGQHLGTSPVLDEHEAGLANVFTGCFAEAPYPSHAYYPDPNYGIFNQSKLGF